VIAEVRNADDSSLGHEAKLRIKLRAVEIGMRVVELSNLAQRLAAVEEKVNDAVQAKA